MNKTAIKNYAIWARVQLIESAKQRAYEYEITENGENNPNLETIGGRLLSKTEKEQRQQLINQIRQKGYTQVMEEAAYTWFNRFIALRFMEVNGYLPSKVRVFTDENNAFKPEILKEAMTIELEGLDRSLVLDLLDKQDNETLYKTLLIAQCNALNTPLPYMFERISNWTELLFPANLLRQDSVIGTMISSIPEEDWTDAVQIIGWLYQYYNSELKDETFALLKKNVKITKERIPAATQLFTPDWIVRYMVENSLGRLWYEGHKDFDKSGWKYYLDEAEQEPEVERQLQTIRAEYAQIKPEEIKVIDPCMGSGHILVYAFDVLMQIYTSAGWSERDAVKSILLNNLWGLDIDDRAGQLAYFAVMMKAQQYDHRWLSRQARNPIQLNVFSLQNSGDWPVFERQMRRAFKNHPSLYEDAAVRVAEALFTAFADAKEFGSIIQPKVTLEDLDMLGNVLDDMMRQSDLMDLVGQADAMSLMDTLLPLIRQARALVQKYHVAVTNPPYMGSSGMGTKLSEYIKIAYPDSKSDLFAVFIERIRPMLIENGYQTMITQHAWMFLSSFEKLRTKMLTIDTVNMAHLGARAFEEIGGEVVQTTSFVLKNSHITGYKGTYCRLIDPNTQQGKEDMFLSEKNRYTTKQDSFASIPGAPIAYWVSANYIHIFNNKCMSDFGASCIGMRTGDNERFLRLWHEVSLSRFGFGFSSAREAQKSGKKWFPYCKGGSFRKWYGNNDYLVNWENDGEEIKENTRRVYPYLGDNLGWKISNENYYFQPGLTWSGVGARVFGVRSYPQGMIFDSGANSFFVNNQTQYFYFAGLLNCVIMNDIINIINPTINTGCGVIAQLPAIVEESRIHEISEIVKNCISISKMDWDSFETSWDFQHHPLVVDRREYRDQMELNCNAEARRASVSLISKRFEMWTAACEERFSQLKTNEEELNRIFIDIYGLQEELTPDVADKDVTVRKADLGRDIRSLISYAVGCMMGRYSLDKPGLAFAGGAWDGSQYSSYMPDHDGILPITDDEYFDDDIVGMFVKWVRTVYGEEALEANLKFIADALGGKGTPREVIRNYFLNDFYADHMKIYQKRPIYWLFSSGKKNGFKCLIYMHRYQPDLLARIRTDYVHEQQERYRTQLTMLEDSLQTAGASERVKLNKQIAKIKDQALELQKYEEKIHHLADQMIPIDLDDGVKVNYAKFQDVLEKIK